MSKLIWSAAALSLLAASTVAGQTAPAKAAKKPAAAVTAASAPTVTADQMKKAQQALADKGLYKGKVSGHGNAAFKAALKKFQKDNQLKVTGRLDQETLAKLGVM